MNGQLLPEAAVTVVSTCFRLCGCVEYNGGEPIGHEQTSPLVFILSRQRSRLVESSRVFIAHCIGYLCHCFLGYAAVAMAVVYNKSDGTFKVSYVLSQNIVMSMAIVRLCSSIARKKIHFSFAEVADCRSAESKRKKKCDRSNFLLLLRLISLFILHFRRVRLITCNFSRRKKEESTLRLLCVRVANATKKWNEEKRRKKRRFPKWNHVRTDALFSRDSISLFAIIFAPSTGKKFARSEKPSHH